MHPGHLGASLCPCWGAVCPGKGGSPALGCCCRTQGFSLDLLSRPRGEALAREGQSRTLASNLLQTGGSSKAAAPALRCKRPSSGLSLSSLSGFYRQLLVGDINCPDEFIDNFEVTEHRRNYPPVQNVKSEKKQVLRRDPTMRRHCGGSGLRHQQFGLLCLFS